REFITEVVDADAQAAYDRREAELTPDVMRELERRVVLAVLDHKWREHLYEMDYLREGIGLRAMAQRDPLVEYQREGFDMFNTMMEGIKEESVAYLFNSQVEFQENPAVEEAPGETPAIADAAGQAPGTGPQDSIGPQDRTGPRDGAGPRDGRVEDGDAGDGTAGTGAGRRSKRKRGVGKGAPAGQGAGGARADGAGTDGRRAGGRGTGGQ